MDDKSILITGCSSGIGLSAALTLKERGYRVFASARKESDVSSLQAQGLEALQLDVNDSLSIQRALDEILRSNAGKLFALFNNAGYMQPGAIEDLSQDQLRAQFETNFFGPAELVRQVLPVMRKQGYGRIIQNTSILGVVTIPYYGAYNASKFALEAFTQTLRQELRNTAIHISIIAPGPITSKLRNNARQQYSLSRDQMQSSHYHAFYEKLAAYYANPPAAERKLTLTPDEVVAKLIHALESTHPKVRYYVGFPAHLMAALKRMLPEFVMDWVVSKLQ